MAGVIEEMRIDKHVNSIVKRGEMIKHLTVGGQPLKGEHLVYHAVRLSALRKLIVHNEHKIPTEKMFEKAEFKYNVEEILNPKGILETIKRLAEETKEDKETLKEDYMEYLETYSADEVKKRALEELVP